MTKKRFIQKDEAIINTITDELVNASSEDSAKIIVDWVNELLEKNAELSKENYGLQDGLDFYKEINRLLTEKINNLEEEIKQLKRERERYKQLSEIRNENINNRILSLKEFINNCEDEKVKNALEDLFYSEVKEYDLAKENRELKEEIKRLKCINKQLEDRLGRDIALNMDCGDVE